MNVFQLKNFKDLSYQIEGLLNRSWVVAELSGENYPKSFYFSKFQGRSSGQNEVVLLCNKYQPIFALVDPDKIPTLDYVKTGFVKNQEIEQALIILLGSSEIQYNILSPEVLNLAFNGKQDFKNKLEALGINESDIAPTIKVLKPELFNYKLFHGCNIGLDLFNSEED